MIDQTDYSVVDDTVDAELACDEALNDPAVVTLTAQIGTLRREYGQRSTSSIVQIGVVLENAYMLLADCWWVWLKRVGISRSSARNYRRLAEWYDVEPHVVDSWATLGPTKLYKLLDLTEDERRVILVEENRAELERMTVNEFEQFIDPGEGSDSGGEPLPPPPGTTMLDGMQRWDLALDEWRQEATLIQDPELRVVLRTEALGLIEELQQLVGVLE